MAELIGEASFLTLLGGKRLGIAAKSANPADLHGRWREHLLEAREINPAGRKPLIRDKRRPLRKHDREIGALHRRSIECAKVALHRRRQPVARAEAFLA